jgi:hypothetical protein
MDKFGPAGNTALLSPSHCIYDVSLTLPEINYVLCQASLLIHRRRGEDERGDWLRLLDSSAANVRRLLAAAAAGQHGEMTRQLRTELRNMVELVEMSGTAFRSREMEIILEAGLAVIRHMKVGKPNRLLFST